MPRVPLKMVIRRYCCSVSGWCVDKNALESSIEIRAMAARP